MTLFALPVILAFTINLTLSLFVFLNNPRRLANRLFGLFVFSFALWNLGEFVMILGRNGAAISWGIRLILFGIFSSSAFFLHFSLVFPRRIHLPWLEKLELVPIYAVPLFLFLLSIWHARYTIHPIPELGGICYYSFAIHSALGFRVQIYLILLYSFLWYAWSFSNLIQSFRRKRGVRERLQLKYLMLGVALVFGIGLLVGVSRLFFPAGRLFFFLGSSYTILVSLFFAVAVLKYRLLNIRLLLQRSLVYFTVTGLLLAIYILVLKNLAGALASIYGVESGVLEGLLIVLLVFLLRPVEKYVSRMLDQIFLRELFQLREKMSEFSRSLLDCIEPNEMACRVARFLKNDVGFPRVLFLLGENKRYKTVCALNWPKKITLQVQSPFVQWLKNQEKPVEWLDITRQFASQPGELPVLSEAAVVVPLQGKEALLGLLFLANFEDRRKFSTDWLEMLDIFSGQVAMAILRVQMIRKVQEREHQLVQAEKLAALGRMVASVSHEIRNPLGVIRASAETLLEQAENLTSAQREVLHFILDETDRLNRVLNSFLDFARPRPLQKQEIDLTRLLERVVHMLRKEGAPEKFSVVFLPPPRRIWVEGDSDQLFLAFLNLGLNGLEAMPDGGTLKIEAKLRDPEYVLVRVVDQGSGIPESDKERVFEPFFSTKENGSGIGLAVTRRIVQEHNGNITFAASADGTVFEMTLPVKKVES